MTKKTIDQVAVIAAPILSGVLLVFAYPWFDMSWLAWFCLVPLFIALSGRNPVGGFWLSVVFGIVFFAGVFDWIREVRGYKIIHHAVLGLYLGPLTGLFGLAYSYIVRRRGLTVALISAPFLWVALEFARSNLFFLSLPMALLAHSQSHYTTLIQMASLTGVYGVSFLVVMSNAALTAAFLFFFGRHEKLSFIRLRPPSRAVVLSMIVVTGLLAGVSLIYGHEVLSRKSEGKEIRISVLQGNIPQNMKWDKKYAWDIIGTYEELTRYASEDQPQLVIWPEASTPGLVLKRRLFLEKIINLIRISDAHFIIGSSEYPKFTKGYDKKKKYGNTALFFDPKGKLRGQYLKIRLVPFSEYIPHKETIPWPDFIIPDKNANFPMSGKDLPLFELNGVKFGTLICWETLHPDLFRHLVKKGANFVVNITNEARYGETKASYQILAMNVFRAIENRVFLARAANTGISCFIDSDGRVTGMVSNHNKNIFVKGYLTKNLRAMSTETFYTQHGDVFALIILAIAIAAVMASSVMATIKKNS